MNSQFSSRIFHIVALRALFVGLCAIVPFHCCDGAKRDVFFEPGLFSIETPDGGFSWKKFKTEQNAETTTHYFTCTRKDIASDSPGDSQEKQRSPLLLLLVDERLANTDGARKAITKAHYKALQTVVVRSGFKIDSKQPKIKTPVPDHIVYGVSGTKEDGSKIFVAGMIYFKNRIYMIQASAPSAAEVKRLIAVGNTFQELYDPDPLGTISGTPAL